MLCFISGQPLLTYQQKDIVDGDEVSFKCVAKYFGTYHELVNTEEHPHINIYHDQQKSRYILNDDEVFATQQTRSGNKIIAVSEK